MANDFLINDPGNARATVLLAHGAGAPMDSAAMEAITDALVGQSIKVARFEFSYMAARRTEGGRKPPPRAERLLPEYLESIKALNCVGPLVIGGKSMGGRVATMVADECHEHGQINGVLCLGYPFHPPNKLTNLRTAHLAELNTPTLIVQGARDPFGTQEEVLEYDLSPSIELEWLPDGDHDLKPRKRVTGLTQADHITTMARLVSNWIDRIA
ncbi:MAG: alpha/beta family hydrolase [Rhizobiaceae bacterium]